MFATLLAVALTARVPKDPAASEYGRLRGTWVCRDVERDGVKERETGRFTYDGRTVTVGDDGKGFVWQITIHATKDLRAIDYARPVKPFERLRPTTPGPDTTVVLRGIYKLEGDTLTLCLCSENISDDGTYRESVRPTEFATRKGDRRVLYRLRREAKWEGR